MMTSMSADKESYRGAARADWSGRERCRFDPQLAAALAEVQAAS